VRHECDDNQQTVPIRQGAVAGRRQATPDISADIERVSGQDIERVSGQDIERVSGQDIDRVSRQDIEQDGDAPVGQVGGQHGGAPDG
jgi:hypothetical protein